MSYTVSILRRAQKELDDLPVQEAERVISAIDALAEDPRPPGCAKLKGRVGWRIRVGDYRVIYNIEDAALTVAVINVGHRRNVYR